MPDRRRELPDWSGTVLKLGAIAAVLWGGLTFIARVSDTVAYAQSSVVRIDSVKVRVDRLEKASGAQSYMTCVMFAETHPAPQVPVYCNDYTRPR